METFQHAKDKWRRRPKWQRSPKHIRNNAALVKSVIFKFQIVILLFYILVKVLGFVNVIFLLAMLRNACSYF